MEQEFNGEERTRTFKQRTQQSSDQMQESWFGLLGGQVHDGKC